jgi:hypothetical protein
MTKTIVLFMLVVILIASCKKNSTPTCEITSPSSGVNIMSGDIVPIIVSTSDLDDDISNVSIYIDDVFLSAKSVFPYFFSINTQGYSAGTYVLKSVVTDDSGLQSTDEISINIYDNSINLSNYGIVAYPLTVGSTCSFSSFNIYGGNSSYGVPDPGCANYNGGDIWFAITVPANGNLNIDTNTGTITDAGMAIYRNLMGELALIECNDDSSVNGLMPYIWLTGQTPNSTLYIRVWRYGSDNGGTFYICAYN